MQILKDIFYLFYPYLCVNCSVELLQSEKYLCIDCNNDLPIIAEDSYMNTKLKSIFYGKVDVKNVQSFLFYKKGNSAQKLIHQLKYKGEEEVGIFIGSWFGEKLKDSQIFKNVDYIIPVPLHPKKLKTRGYNQLTKFGLELSKLLSIEYKPDVLIRTSITKTQTLKHRFERFSNNQTKFKLLDKLVFKNKHILLIDDVITTGATLEACAKELNKTENITISIATMAYTQKD